MGHHGKVIQGRIGNHSGRDSIEPFPPLQRPHFRTQKAKTDLSESVVQVDEDEVLIVLDQGMIEDKRSGLAVKGVGQALSALLPSSGQRREVEHWACSPLGIGPDSGERRGDQRRLPRQFKGDLDNFLNVLWVEPKFPLRFMQPLSQFLDLVGEITLEFEQLPHRLSLGLGLLGVEAWSDARASLPRLDRR